ncbi:unnamed protein product [Caenorhabditis brenneri]
MILLTFSLRLLIILTLSSAVLCECDDNGVIYANGDKWIRNNHFLVTCRNGKIQTLKCVTDSGHLLDVGSKTYVEQGYEYTCAHEQAETLNTNTCPTFADFSDDIFKDRFAICCISRRFKGCVDVNGDIVKDGFFIIGNRSLKYCRIQPNQLMARIEPKGCFNGTTNDDIHDESLHIKKYAVWREGDIEYRCGDDGVHIQRCFPKELKNKAIWAGTAWIQDDGQVKTCGKIH